jgi:hypothetical protein
MAIFRQNPNLDRKVESAQNSDSANWSSFIFLPKDPKKIHRNSCLHFSAKLLACSGNVYRGGPLVGVIRKILVAGTMFSETSMVGPLGVAVGRSGSGHHKSGRRQWRAPWRLLSGFSAAATTEVGDVDGGPPGGCCRQVWQRPPPELETSMVGPWGLLSGFPAAATIRV